VAEIDQVIATAPLDQGIRERSRLAFRLLGQAEARAHGVSQDKVRLHEAGAVDAIIDVVGSFVLADDLGAEAFYASAIPLCRGSIETDHGIMPLPAPATVNILEAVGAPTFYKEGEAELVTPTGAAIVGACAVFASPRVSAEHEGFGAGTADLPWPNVVRVVVGDLVEDSAWIANQDEGATEVAAAFVTEVEPEAALGAEPEVAPVAATEDASAPVDVPPEAAPGAETVAVIETNIDDMAPNLLAEIPRTMLDAGALEAFLTPVVMKKGRSGHLVTVVCATSDAEALAARLLRETSTLGVRVREERRIVADRRIEKLDSSLGEIAVKLKLQDGRVVEAVPEHDDVLAAAERAVVPLAEAHRRLSEEARRKFVEPT
jgi:uncharacterized protein (TIGR00299 family) protein